MSDTSTRKSNAEFGAMSVDDATATIGKFAGYYVTKAIVLNEVLDSAGTDITAQFIKSGAGGTQQPGGYLTPRTTGKYISSITHDGTGEIVVVWANAQYA